MKPQHSALLAALITGITAILEKAGVHAAPTVIAAAATGILALVHTVAHPPIRKKLRKVLPHRRAGHVGLGLWVWNATDPNGHIQKARAHKYGWVAVKVHDGTNPYNGMGMIHEYKRLCDKYGIKFGVWGFVRGDDGETAANMCQQYGAAFYIADVEESIQTRKWIAAFSQRLAHVHHTLSSRHLSSFGRVDLHPEIDWRVWSEAGWGFMPQAYSCESVELSPTACLRHAEDFWARDRIQPTLGAYTGARGRLTGDQLAGQCKGLKLSGVNVWEASTATPLDLDRISKVL